MRHRLAVCLVAALVLATALPSAARALGPADLLPDLHGLLRWLWAEVGSDLDPSGRPTPPPNQVGSSLDPSGHRLWEEVGSDLDPSGRSAPPPSQEGSDLDPDGARRQVGSSLDPNG